MLNVWNSNDKANEIEQCWETEQEQQHRQQVARIVNQYLMNENILLDAGCGSGEVYKYLREYLKEKNAYYIGIDGSIPFLDKCRVRYSADNSFADVENWIHQNRVRFELQNLEKTVFLDNTFDLAICIDVVQHVQYYESIIKEIFRISKSLIIRTWLSKKPDKIDFKGEYYDNIYNEEMFSNFCSKLGKCKGIENGLYLLSK